MAFEFKVGHDNEPDERRLETNATALDGWKAAARLAERTRETYEIHIKLFLSRLDDDLLVTDLTPGMWRSYLANASATCRFLRRNRLAANGGIQDLCAHDQDLGGCGTSCPEYEPTRMTTLDNHVRAVASLYSYLDFENYIDVNFVSQVYGAFKKSIGRITEEDPKYYCPTMDQVRTLIQGTRAEPRRTMYIFMAKTGTRIEETATLSIDANELRLDEGYIEVTGRRKRKGNPYLIVDPELDRHLETYMRWRDRVAKDSTRTLFCSPQGDPLSVGNLPKLNARWWQRDARRLQLQAPNAPPGRRWHSHSMRHFFSDYISEQGIPDLWYHVLRGDKVKGTLGTYTEHKRLDRIRQQYLRHAPILAL